MDEDLVAVIGGDESKPRSASKNFTFPVGTALPLQLNSRYARHLRTSRTRLARSRYPPGCRLRCSHDSTHSRRSYDVDRCAGTRLVLVGGIVAGSAP